MMEETWIMERFSLVRGRIGEFAEKQEVQPPFTDYFKRMAEYTGVLCEAWDYIGSGAYENASLEDLRALNHRLYAPALEEVQDGISYEKSFLNPTYACVLLGEDFGALLSFLASELFGSIPFLYERNLEELTIRLELLAEVYTAFAAAEEGCSPKVEEIRGILYWYMSDYQEDTCLRRVGEKLGAVSGIGEKILKNADLSDVRYLYRYGEYVTPNEERLAEFLWQLPQEEIRKMADTYTEGYRIGFETTNKDLSKKKTVAVEYHIGLERMLRQAVENFEAMGLQAVIFRASSNALEGRSMNKRGYYGASCNRQFEYDHDEDDAFYMDRAFLNRKLEASRAAYEKYKEFAAVHAGPAVVEVFGEEPFDPQNKKEAFHCPEPVQKLKTEFSMAMGELVNQYIPGEERSFTIIAFPVPDIGPEFEEIFRETVKLNTLDYMLYRRLQQILIDALDQADSVEIHGMNGNLTDLRVALHEKKDPLKETNFENCVADVNIPVGEVFTSPNLAGTNGLLHVKKVFLNGLEYRDLKIRLKDGCTDTYGCGNFETAQEGERYIKEHILYHHECLPLGEFAIGTNTTAYVMARKFGIEAKLPILIAEKTGPHFALGDTCYSHAEEVRVYNPDGKEIVAKDNEISLLRNTDRKKAYFNCHTDITIPYDELGELSAVDGNGKKTLLIEKGRFVLPGLEELNRPLEE